MEIVQLWTMFCHLCSHKIISLCNENAGSMFARTQDDHRIEQNKKK